MIAPTGQKGGGRTQNTHLERAKGVDATSAAGDRLDDGHRAITFCRGDLDDKHM